MKYDNYRYCRLKDGTIHSLFYGKTNKKKNFCEINGVWYLFYEEIVGDLVVLRMEEIVEFIKPIIDQKKIQRKINKAKKK